MTAATQCAIIEAFEQGKITLIDGKEGMIEFYLPGNTLSYLCLSKLVHEHSQIMLGNF